jgi:hypothetical protein
MIKLLSYIGLDITREHFLTAARYGQVDMIKFISQPNNRISDEWLAKHKIDFKGQKKISLGFNFNSRKTRNYMRQFYQIAIGKDNLELYQYLEKLRIKNPFTRDGFFLIDHVETVIKTSSKISIYLFEKGKINITTRNSRRHYLKKCCKYGNEKVFFYLIEKDWRKFGWGSDSSSINDFLRVCYKIISNPNLKRRVKIVRYLMQELGIDETPVFDNYYKVSIYQSDVDQLRDLIYNKVSPPDDFSRVAFEYGDRNFIKVCVEAGIVDLPLMWSGVNIS